MIIAEHKEPMPATVSDGITLFTTHVRRATPDTLDPKLNAHSKLNDITACIQAYTAGADEALMLDPHGFVATCNCTHFFGRRHATDGPEVWTSDGSFCLGGITRGNVLHVCREAGIAARETTFSLTDVYSASEAFCTGTFAGVVPVRTVDGRTIGTGRRGPVVARLQQLYADLVAADVARSVRRRDHAGRGVVGPAQHLHGDDARLGEPARHRRRRRAALCGLPGRTGSTIPAATRCWPPADRPDVGGRGPAARRCPPARRCSTRSTCPTTCSPTRAPGLGRRLPQRAADPHAREVVASYVRSRDECEPDDIGLLQQERLLDVLDDAGEHPPVIDAADFLRDPEGYLRWLCDWLGIDFTDRMLPGRPARATPTASGRRTGTTPCGPPPASSRTAPRRSTSTPRRRGRGGLPAGVRTAARPPPRAAIRGELTPFRASNGALRLTAAPEHPHQAKGSGVAPGSWASSSRACAATLCSTSTS